MSASGHKLPLTVASGSLTAIGIRRAGADYSDDRGRAGIAKIKTAAARPPFLFPPN
jgi:hypothetical protein